MSSSSGSLVPPYWKKSTPRGEIRRVTFEGKLRRASISRSCATIPFTCPNPYFPFSVNRVSLTDYAFGAYTAYIRSCKRSKNVQYIADIVKGALGIMNWAVGSYCLVFTKANHCSEFRIPKCAIANDQLPKQPLLN